MAITVPSNTAAWSNEVKSHPLEVIQSPYPSAQPNPVVIKTAAVAMNPADHYEQSYGFFHLKYPTVLGIDVAGEIVEVGDGVTRFKKGDRVLAYVHSLTPDEDREDWW